MLKISTGTVYMERYPTIPKVSNLKDNKVVNFKGKQQDFETICPLCISSCDLERKLETFQDKINQPSKRDIFSYEWSITTGFGGHVVKTFSLSHRIPIKCH